MKKLIDVSKMIQYGQKRVGKIIFLSTLGIDVVSLFVAGMAFSSKHYIGAAALIGLTIIPKLLFYEFKVEIKKHDG